MAITLRNSDLSNECSLTCDITVGYDYWIAIRLIVRHRCPSAANGLTSRSSRYFKTSFTYLLLAPCPYITVRSLARD